MARYTYPGILFGYVTIAGGAFTAPATLPVSAGGTPLYDGLSLDVLARIGEFVTEDDPAYDQAAPEEKVAHRLYPLAGKAYYPMVDITVVSADKQKKATFNDVLNTSTPRQIAGSCGVETVTKTIDRTYDLESIPQSVASSRTAATAAAKLRAAELHREGKTLEAVYHLLANQE